MNYEIVEFHAMTVIGTELRTTWKNGECMAVILAFWQQQRSENRVQQIPHKMDPDVTVGLYTNYTPDFSLTEGYYSLVK